MDDKTAPSVLVIGGANGAGKSTLARLLLPATLPFLNADQIAETLPADYPSPDREAARLLLGRWDNLAVKPRSFAIETTLASRTLAPRLRRLQADGWRVRLVFVTTPSADLNVARVACRVRAGGHDIPEQTIRRRWAKGRRHFTDLYRPLADRWHVFENADVNGPVWIGSGGDGAGTPLDDGAEVLRRFQTAVREAVSDHRWNRSPIAGWQNGVVVEEAPGQGAVGTTSNSPTAA